MSKELSMRVHHLMNWYATSPNAWYPHCGIFRPNRYDNPDNLHTIYMRSEGDGVTVSVDVCYENDYIEVGGLNDGELNFFRDWLRSEMRKS